MWPSFSNSGKKGKVNEEGSKLEVYCYALKKGEVDELIIMLEEKNFKLVFVDKNSIKAVKEGNNREIYQAKKRLEKEGFSWSEKP